MNFPVIIFNKVDYVNCELIIENAPIYSKGSRNTRSLIKSKNIPVDMYIFAKKNDNNKWIKAEGKSIKYDKILLKKDYLVNIPELQKDNQSIVSDDGTVKAPPIIELTDAEKFKDENGNTVEIETRGTRNCNDVYFKVKDVSIGFKMDSLYTTVIDTRRGYIIDKDYKYFMCTKTNLNKNFIIKKELFLTLRGMRRLIEVSHTQMSHIMKTIIHHWVNQFDIKYVKKFNININQNHAQRNIGYVYCITSNIINCVKIGFWTSSIISLRARYTTYYGNNLNMFYVKTNNARKLESKCHKYFAKYRLENELFNINYMKEYVDFLNKHKEDDVENIEL